MAAEAEEAERERGYAEHDAGDEVTVPTLRLAVATGELGPLRVRLGVRLLLEPLLLGILAGHGPRLR